MRYEFYNILPRQWTSGVWQTGFYHFFCGVIMPLACEVYNKNIKKDDKIIIGGFTPKEILQWQYRIDELEWDIVLTSTEKAIDCIPLIGFDFKTSFESFKPCDLPPYTIEALRYFLNIPPPCDSLEGLVFADRVKCRRYFKMSDDIRLHLKSLGFNIVDFSQISFKEAAKIVGDAKIIIGQHGAGLTNIIFASTKCEVIEYNFSKKIYFHFKNLADTIGCSYNSLPDIKTIDELDQLLHKLSNCS